MCNFHHPGPRRVWDGGPSRGPCHHFRGFRGFRGSGGVFPKRRSCCYTRHFRAREVRGPFRAMRRLRSWSGSPRSRARESIAKSTFIRKTHMIWNTFFVFLPDGAQRLVFTLNYHLRDDQDFTILTPNWPISTSGPRGASGIQLGHKLTQSGSNLTTIQ